MMPARLRGRIDLAINGTYWAGALIGAVVTLLVLNHLSPGLGWRIAYIVGPVLALVIIYVRRNLPESPRWQIMHGGQAEAEASIKEIEDHVQATTGSLPPVDQSKELEIRPATQIGYFALLRALFKQYRQTLCWAVIFFFASAGASAGYLTASEVFPLEVRAKAIAVFFAIAQCFGAFGSAWYGHLIGDGTNRNTLFVGYIVGAVAMVLGGLAAVFFGVNAEGKSLEGVAKPLSVITKPSQAIFRSGSDGPAT